MKKRKFTALIMSAIMGAMLLTGCGSSQSEATDEASTQPAAESSEEASVEEEAETDETVTEAADTEETAQADGPVLASIKEAGKLVVGTASGYPPYEFIDITSPDQAVVGIDMELAKKIAEELGVELEIQDMTFTSLISSIPTHKVDMAIAGISITEERKETMDFSEPYLEAAQKILILKENAEKYNTLESFSGEAVAAEKSTTQEAVAQELMADSPLVSLEKVPDCLMELQNGKVAGVVVEGIVGEQYVFAYDNIVFSDADMERSKTSAVALDKGNEDLIAIINKVIAENVENGNFDKWVEEYSEKAAANAKE